MHKKQFILLAAAIIFLLLLFIFGKTVNPNNPVAQVATNNTSESLNFNEVLMNAKSRLTNTQKKLVEQLENRLKQTETTEKIGTYNHLAQFWKDSIKLYEPYLFYTAEAAKLENSEKSLTFAAQQFTSNLLDVADPAIQNWLATNAKVLFEKALAINPNNDSNKIGLGACYIFGNISNNPMEGILPVREIATKTPDNLYAQMVLGLGGKKSGQLDKAIERFLIIVQKQPKNLSGILNLAECYELKKDNINAKIWYLKAAEIIDNVEIKKEIQKRVNELK